MVRAFARLVAGNLRCRSRARVELGDTANVPWDLGTFGSASVRTDGVLLARAAAFARRCLIERAAQRWLIAHLTPDGEGGTKLQQRERVKNRLRHRRRGR